MHRVKHYFHSRETELCKTVDSEHFNTVNKMCVYHKYVNSNMNISYISHKPWVTLYAFCTEFRILVSNICWNFIIFENWRK